MNPDPGSTGHRKRILGVVGAYHLLNDAAIVSLAPLLPLLREDIRQLNDYSAVGLLMGLGLAVTALVQYLAGRASDRRDPRFMLAGGLALLGCSMLLLSRVETFLQVLLVVAIVRVGSSFYHPVGIAWLGRRFKEEKLDSAMGFQSACGDAGVLSGVLVAGLVGAAYGWQAPLLLWGALTIMGVVIGLGLTLPLQRARTTDNHPEPTSKDSSPENLSIPSARPLTADLLALAVGGAAVGVTLTYLPLMAVDELGLTPRQASLLLAGWLAIGTFAALSYHRIRRIASRRRLLTVSFMAAALGSLLLAGAPDLTGAWQILLLASGLVLGGLGLFTSYPVQFSVIAAKIDQQAQGGVFGMVFAAQVLGSAGLVFVAGWMAQMAGSVSIPFLLIGLVCLLAALDGYYWITTDTTDCAGKDD